MTSLAEDAWSAVNRTAQTVAALRRLEVLLHGEHALIDDPTLECLLGADEFAAEQLAGIALPADLGAGLPALAAWLAGAETDEHARRLRQHVDRLAIRTAKIDALLGQFLPEVTQCVILGAGLDTRAWRLAASARVMLYEVDFPHVLDFKAARLAGLPLVCAARHALAADVAAPDLGARLAAAGFRREQPTVWLIEGVIVYLTAAQITALNTNLASLSAPGSRLIATFMGEGVSGMFSAGMISRFDDAPTLLARYGWQARQLHYADIAREYGRDYPDDYTVYLACTEPRA
ncbi:MAG: SAM-dependent methyltransferase [Gammaproteobacteria bacterium]